MTVSHEMQSSTNIRLKGFASGFITKSIEGRKNAFSVELLKSRMGYLMQLGLSKDELVTLVDLYAEKQDEESFPAIEKMRRLL